MKNLVAVKVLLEGVSKSVMKRDGKTLDQIIKELKPRATACMVTEADMHQVCTQTIEAMFNEK